MQSSTMIPTPTRNHFSVNRATVVLLTAGFGFVCSAAQTSGDDAPKAAKGKIVVAAVEVFRGVPQADQFRSLILVDPENGAIESIGDRDLEAGFLSPDGRFLAEVISIGGDPDKVGIWIEDLTGETPRKRIFNRPGAPTWSGDGKQLVIGTRVEGRKFETYRVNADGSGLTKLPIPETEFVVDWSHDGAWLASWNPVRKTRETHILLMHPDGTGSHEIVNEDGAGGGFRISPDGREVIYVITKGDGPQWTDSLWVSKADGTNRKRLPLEFDEGLMVQPRWSPDGSRIALGLKWNGRPPVGKADQIMIVNRDGKEPRTLPIPPTWRVHLNGWK